MQVEEATEGYARLLVADPAATADAAERFTKVELAADIRLNSPVQMSVGPVLHRDDVAAGKVSALFTRAAARDYIDVASLVLGGHYSHEQLLDLAAERDGGFDVGVFAQMLSGMTRYKDVDFLRYGISRNFLAEIKTEVASWYEQLTGAALPRPDVGQTPQAKAALTRSPAREAASRPPG